MDDIARKVIEAGLCTPLALFSNQTNYLFICGGSNISYYGWTNVPPLAWALPKSPGTTTLYDSPDDGELLYQVGNTYWVRFKP